MGSSAVLVFIASTGRLKVGNGETKGVSGRLGDEVSAGVGGVEGGHPLHVREHMAQVGAWHLKYDRRNVGG